MNTNFNFIPPAAYLAFLGAVFGTAFTLVVMLFGTAFRKWIVVRWMAMVWLAGFSLYVVLLLSCSLLSHEIVLVPGDEKHFCEIDCHTAYSIAGVKRTAVIGERHASGAYYVVAVRTRFDRNTISPRRPLDAPLTPNSRRVALELADGRQLAPVTVDAAALAAQFGMQSVSFRQPLKPGDDYVTLLAFDLPPNATARRLLLTSADWETRLLMGNENSFFHRRMYFAL